MNEVFTKFPGCVPSSQSVKETGNLTNENWKNNIYPRSGEWINSQWNKRDIINSKQDEVVVSNKEVKFFLMKQLQDSIQFFTSKTRIGHWSFFAKA